MRFWLCASLVVTAISLARPPRVYPQASPAEKRVNELILAGLRPGKDTLATADARYRAKYRKAAQEARNIVEWADECTGRTLWLEIDGNKVIQSIGVSALGRVSQEENLDCSQSVRDVLRTKWWRTGRGLKLGEPRHRIIELYGEPNSSGPSTKGNRELELLFYAFDWAGSDVPQVMEVSCERATGRVVEITLAFPAL